MFQEWLARKWLAEVAARQVALDLLERSPAMAELMLEEMNLKDQGQDTDAVELSRASLRMAAESDYMQRVAWVESLVSSSGLDPLSFQAEVARLAPLAYKPDTYRKLPTFPIIPKEALCPVSLAWL